MAQITNILVDQDVNTLPEYERLSDKDVNLVSSYKVNSLFDPETDKIELHFYSPGNSRLYSEYSYKTARILGQTDPDTRDTSNLYLDPIKDAQEYGFGASDIKVLYHFLRDLFSSNKDGAQFYIEDISSDRTEILAISTALSQEQVYNRVNLIKSQLEDESYFFEFRLNFLQNDLYIGVNIDTLEYEGGTAITLKLYEPLPLAYSNKDVFFVVEKVSDSVFYEITSTVEQESIKYPKLREANFNIEVEDGNSVPSQYYNYDELFSYPISSSYYEAYSLVNEKSITPNIDYSDYGNFIQFSSAEERVRNFKYKVDLLTSYENSLTLINSSSYSLEGVSGSRSYYEGLINGLISNFDHYEKYLYFESSSYAWPKSSNTRPYINQPSTTQEAINWYSGQIVSASSFDSTNYNALINTIPSFLREDTQNEPALLFTYMLGQHFDNIYIYSKAVTDKYDNDNRLNTGISKELVGEVLKNFGVKLYNSQDSLENIFKLFTGESYQSGSFNEIITNYITVPGAPVDAQPIPVQDYTGEVYKRIYHNLPFLLKAKGSERGLRALINCFGIPSDILDIKLYGGANTTQGKFFGYEQSVTSSLDKIRIENSGSIISGSTLSIATSIKKPEAVYTQDTHRIEIGFSPSDAINEYIISTVSSSFDIGEYIGDPRDASASSYDALQRKAVDVLGSLTKYRLNDFVRLIKFFDNVLFKMVKDFVPARATVDTGIIIKPNLLNRSKAKSTTATGIRPEYSGSINISAATGSTGGVFESRSIEYSTDYSEIVHTKSGSLLKPVSNDRPKYDGEFSGSTVLITNGELNSQNIFKQLLQPELNFDIFFVEESDIVLTLFNIATTSDTSDAIACSLTGSYTSAYHDGTGTYPIGSDTVFTDSSGSAVFNGDGEYWAVQGSTNALQINTSGVVTATSDCTQYDSTPPSGYSINLSGYNTTYTNASTVNSTTMYLYGGEVGATYHVTASDGTTTTNLTSGTVTSATTQSISLNLSSFNDATIQVSASLADANNNSGTQVFDTIIKDATTPSGYSVAFSQSTIYDNLTTLNLSGIPTTSNTAGGQISYTITSTGGGTVNGTATIGASSTQNISNINISSLGNGTLTASVTLRDLAYNIGSAVTGTATKSAATISMSRTSILYVPQAGGVYYFDVNVTPDATPWYIQAGISSGNSISVSPSSYTTDYSGIMLDIAPNTSGVTGYGQVEAYVSGSTTKASFPIQQYANS